MLKVLWPQGLYAEEQVYYSLINGIPPTANSEFPEIVRDYQLYV